MASGGHYHLRDRGEIIRPSRFTNTQQPNATRIAIVRKRAGKRSSITKRIMQINVIIQREGSRTKLTSLQGRLQLILDEAYECHEAFVRTLSSEDAENNDEYIENLRIAVDNCVSDIREYLERRIHDSRSECPSAPVQQLLADDERMTCSTGPLTQRLGDWIQQLPSTDPVDLAVDDVTQRFGALAVTPLAAENGGLFEQASLSGRALQHNIDLKSIQQVSEVEGISVPYYQEVTDLPQFLQGSDLIHDDALPKNTFNQSFLFNTETTTPSVSLSFNINPLLRLSHHGQTTKTTGNYQEDLDLDVVVVGNYPKTRAEGYHGEDKVLGSNNNVTFRNNNKLVNKSPHVSGARARDVNPPGFVYPSVPKTETFCHTGPALYASSSIAQSSIAIGRLANQTAPIMSTMHPSIGNTTAYQDKRGTGRATMSSSANHGRAAMACMDQETFSRPSATIGVQRALPHEINNRDEQFYNLADSWPNSQWPVCAPNMTSFDHPSNVQMESPMITSSDSINFTTSLPAWNTMYVGDRQDLPVSSIHQNRVHLNNCENGGRSHTGRKPVDAWIHELPMQEIEHNRNNHHIAGIFSESDIACRWIINQNLPRIDIPKFDGSPILWVEFITHFKEMVHCQPYLSSAQRMAYLQQHLEGEAKKSIQGFNTDWSSYKMALQRLKYMFGQRASVAHAHLSRVTKGKQIVNNDTESLTGLFYDISNCLQTLDRLQYYADLHSTDVLRQTIRRLPERLQRKWSEKSYVIRSRGYEPDLTHLEKWLKDRIMAARDPYLPKEKKKASEEESKYRKDTSSSTFSTKVKAEKSEKEENENREGLVETKEGSEREELNAFEKRRQKQTRLCPLCNEEHLIYACRKYKEKDVQARYSFVMDKRLCMNCLRPGHRGGACKSKFNCFSPGCKESHHTSLHEYFVKGCVIPVSSHTIGIGEDSAAVNTGVHCSHSMRNKEVYLKIIPVRISSDTDVVDTFAFLDDGSTDSFIKEDLAKRLRLKGKKEKITLSTITGSGRPFVTSRVSFNLCGTSPGFGALRVKDAYVMPSDNFSVGSQTLPKDFETNARYQHLQGFGFKPVAKEQIQILLGADNVEALSPIEIRSGADVDSPAAAKTLLAWTMWGRDEVPSKGIHLQAFRTEVNALEKLNKAMQDLWKTDAFGTKFNETKSTSAEDRQVEEMWSATAVYKDGHLVVPMPWRDPPFFTMDQEKPLPDNEPLARRRFESLLKRFRKDPNLHQMYRKNIHKFLEEGHAVKMNPEEAAVRSHRTWYLPHHPVMNENKPGKVRTVFDPTARSRNICLSDKLKTGPDLTNNLVGVLLRFRDGIFAFAADVECMFHQVRVTDEDSDALRFLWQDDLNGSLSPETYKMLVHIFGAKSSSSSAAYALKRTVQDFGLGFGEEARRTILRNFYVDDLLKSVHSIPAAIKIISEVIAILKKGGFHLTKFVSNSKEVLCSLPSTELVHSAEYMDIEENPIERALGIRWDIKKDVFIFVYNVKERPLTKRGILQTLASIFDPLGFLTPFTVTIKILLQRLWRRGRGWDDPIDQEEEFTWRKWLDELKQLSMFEVPRCYHTNTDSEPEERQLHVFADASEAAFGAVAYLRTSYTNGTTDCCLLMSKSRLAPLKTLTIPRLELQAAVLAVRLKSAIINEIDFIVDQIILWSDSVITLQYIHNESKRFKVFVANRVAEIHEESEITQWRFVPGDENPADSLTRGMDVADMIKDSKWLQGPHFLKQVEKCWPLQNWGKDIGGDDIEVRQVMKVSVDRNFQDRLEIHSSWTKLLHIVAWILRFSSNCKDKGPAKQTGLLSLHEISAARNMVFCIVQQNGFPEELAALNHNKAVKKESKLKALNPFIDQRDNLIRVGGRLRKICIPYAARHQIILPSKDVIVEKLVRYEHKLNADCGPETLHSRIQQNYWIIGVKRLTKKVIRACLDCKKRNAKPEVPLMADLPTSRLAMESPVFHHTGIDYFGPVDTKLGRRVQKRWGCIFTCLVTRAVHLELAESLSTDAFINTLERFINRRGSPSYIVSDCGTNFKGAQKELAKCLEELKQAKIVEFTIRKNIVWKFNPPSAPHMGGAWERLVRSVKTSLKSILNGRTLTDMQLYTALTEAESIINSRPLTAVSDDINDLEALTPNHFLIGRESPNLPFGITYDSDNCSRKRWRELQQMTSHFWKRWLLEYLPKLSIRPKWTTEARNMQVGDLVMIVEDNIPRGFWKMARVIKVFPGDDSRTRVAEVKTASGMLTRPVSKLCLLESNLE